jgi:hypothetical protein
MMGRVAKSKIYQSLPGVGLSTDHTTDSSLAGEKNTYTDCTGKTRTSKGTEIRLIR